MIMYIGPRRNGVLTYVRVPPWLGVASDRWIVLSAHLGVFFAGSGSRTCAERTVHRVHRLRIVFGHF